MYYKLLKLSKEHSEIKSVASRTSYALKKCIKDSNGNKEQFIQMCQLRIAHFCGNHKKCHLWKKTVCKLNIGVFKEISQEVYKVIIIITIINNLFIYYIIL